MVRKGGNVGDGDIRGGGQVSGGGHVSYIRYDWVRAVLSTERR